jgi:hypothetical protein
MSSIEDILYESKELGIYEKVLRRLHKLQKTNPHGHLDKLYDEAFAIEKKIKFDEDKHNS